MTKTQRLGIERRKNLASEYARNEQEFLAVTKTPKLRTVEEQTIFLQVKSRKIVEKSGVQPWRKRQREATARKATTEAERQAFLTPPKERTEEQKRLIRKADAKTYKTTRMAVVNSDPRFNPKLAETVRAIKASMPPPPSVQRRRQASSFKGMDFEGEQKPHGTYTPAPKTSAKSLAILSSAY